MEIVDKEQIVDKVVDINDLEKNNILAIKYSDDIYKNELEIIHLLKEKRERENYILQIKQKLYKTCEHHFTRDSSAAFDDIFKWKCSKCNLYKGEFR